MRHGILIFAGLAMTAYGADTWPQRKLMEARFEDSLEYRSLTKPVYESAVVDDMEADGNWSAQGIGTLGYTTERARNGKRSLRFRTQMRDEQHIRANRKGGSFVGGQGGSSWARLTFAQPRDWSRFNRISLWVYVHPTSMRAYSFNLGFQCDGAPGGALDPVPAHFVHDLKPGEWNHVFWEIPEYKRDRVTSFTISQILRGHDPEDEGTVTYDFDQIEVQRVDPQPYEGWEVAPGRIAFQHVGYRPPEEKIAISSGLKGGEFEVVDAASGKSAARFPIKTVENRRGRFQVLDFTTFTKPGRYTLRCGAVVSRPFAISGDLWYGTIEKVLNAYYGLRCGFDVPGVHRVCHQDVQGTHEGVTKIINGGWHDAGDLSQGSHRTGASVYAMLQIYDQLRQRGLRPDLQARLLEEARWGLDWLLKTRFGNGYRITWALGRIYTDNKVGTIDDVVVPATRIPFENFLFCATAAYASRVMKDADPERAARSLQAAEEDYRATLEHRADWSAATREEAAFGALASAELFRATGKEEYTEQAARFGRLLIQCQEQTFVDGIPVTGYFYTNTQRQRIVHDYHLSFEEAPLLALQALCETYPNHPDWMEWYGAAVLHSDYFFRKGSAVSKPYSLVPNSVWRRSELAPGRQPQGGLARDEAAMLEQFNAGTKLAEDYRLRVFPIWQDYLFHGNTAIHLSGTTALTAAAQIRNTPALQDLVRRQLQWIFGGNPFSESLMYGEGYDYQPLFVYCLRNLTGGMPVGMDSRHGDSPCWPAVNIATFKEIWVVPMSRLLWTLAYSGMPARVTGTAPAGAVLTEKRTRSTVKLPSGNFGTNLAAGDYTIRYGTAVKKMALLPGGRYRIALDPRRAIEVRLSSARVADGQIEITAHVTGAGAHKLELRPFNGTLDSNEASVDLTPGRARTLIWKLKVAVEDKPWGVVAISDRDLATRTELFGTMRELATLD